MEDEEEIMKVVAFLSGAIIEREKYGQLGPETIKTLKRLMRK